jgi:hypothetical protein
MSMLLKTALLVVPPLATVLWMTPLASAHDDYRYHERRPAWSSAAPYRHFDSSRYPDWYGRDRYDYGRSQAYGENRWKYNKAMDRLARQEREAREKAYRKYGGNLHDSRFREQLAEIDRKYDHKRDKVERNWGR